jgi:molecular chaperone GrpE
MGSEDQTDQQQTQQSSIDNEEGLVEGGIDEITVEEGEVTEQDLQASLEAANARADENWEKLLLATAEVENIRRRTQKDIEKAHRFSVEKFAKDLLPVLDSLEMGLAASEGVAGDVAAIRDGMELTHKQLISALQKSGVDVVDPEGQTFNPDLHQAMSVVPSPDHEPNTVMQVFQKGYTLSGRLLRPAMVIVSQATPPAGTKKIDEQA